MKRGVTLHFDRDQAAGIAAALFLHFIMLFGLLNYRFTPSPSESVPVFVTIISPDAPASGALPRPDAPKL